MKATGGTSKGELTYTLEGVAADLRADGRGRLDYRHLTLELALQALRAFPTTTVEDEDVSSFRQRREASASARCGGTQRRRAQIVETDFLVR